jgi:predicted O-methyltransferase YrrM
MTFYFAETIVCPDDPTATPKRIQEYREYYKVKYDICKKQNPKVIAEIGVRAGYSAWSFLQACPDAGYIGFDANNGTHGGQGGQNGKYFEWAKNILRIYNHRLIELDTQTVDSLNIREVDLFHVDGDHTSKGVQHDLDLAYKVISDTGLILIDDITYIKTVSDGVNKWVEKMGNKITYEFVKSLRGEMLIRRDI